MPKLPPIPLAQRDRHDLHGDKAEAIRSADKNPSPAGDDGQLGQQGNRQANPSYARNV